MRHVGIAYRAHDPRWAFAPLSGAGAAARGGRFNPKGVEALYLALSVEGMIAEMGHGFGNRFEPLTICSYTLDVDDVVDLRNESACRAACVAPDDLACAWADAASRGIRPASWGVAETLIAAGAAGLLVRSFAAHARLDMMNIVLWTWGPDLPHRVTVHDPSGRLPLDQSAWPVR